MATTVVLVLEGVLAGRDDEVELTQSQLDPVGHLLYASFGRSRLLLATRLDRRFVDHWCRLNMLNQHAGIVPLDDKLIQRMMASGDKPELYIDHDGQRCAVAIRSGVNSLLFTRPLYATVTPGASSLPGLQRPWADAVRESQAQRAKRRVPVPDDE